MNAEVSSSHTHGRAMTVRVTRSQNPPGRPCSRASARVIQPAQDAPRLIPFVKRIRKAATSPQRDRARRRAGGAPRADGTATPTPAASEDQQQDEHVPDDRLPGPVEPVGHRLGPGAEERQERGEQRHRQGDRHEDHDDRAPCERAEDGRRDEEHPGQRQDHGHAAEEDGAVRRGTRPPDRLELVAAALPLLPVPRDDEQRVVDPDGQAHHRDQVRGEEAELPQLSEQPDEPRTPRRSRRRP